ncbi:MAG: PAS domain S-box protein [Deltaproteobacteria bacterium]|nr:PAS domain S-box protein [Deltaproteobacteria bacterium]
MPYKIRTKLIIAFFAIIFPFIAIVGVIALYNTKTIHNASLKAEAISEELQLVLSLQLAIDKSLMPGNDYIITGDKRYIDEFNDASKDAEDLIKKVEKTHVVLEGMDTPDKSTRGQAPVIQEEMEILKSTNTAWQNIKEISQKIFAIPEPVGNREAAALMEEMDYKWAYPAIKMLDRHREIDRKEHAEAVEELQRGWMMSWAIMIGGAVILITFGVFFALFYSRIFTRPIEIIHNGADAIAGGDFKTRLDIKTGDEIQQLANAMNEMAAQLDNFYATLEQKIDERTAELKESEERFRSVSESAPDAIICLNGHGSIYFWNKKAEEMFGYKADEAINRHIHDVICPERYKEKAGEGFKEFSKTGAGPVVGKTIEIEGLKKDGTEFPVELSISAVNIKGEWHATGIIRDITGRKEAEKKIAEQMDFLERFHKASVQREFRIKELRDENEALKKKIQEMEKK